MNEKENTSDSMRMMNGKIDPIMLMLMNGGDTSKMLPFLMMHHDDLKKNPALFNMLTGGKNFGPIFGEGDNVDPILLSLMNNSIPSSKNKNEKNVYPPRDGHSVERGLKALGNAIRDFALVHASPEYAKYLADKQIELAKEEDEKEKESKLKFEKNQEIYNKVVNHLKSLLSSKIKELSSDKDKKEFETLLNLSEYLDLCTLILISSQYLSEKEFKDLKEFLKNALLEKFKDMNFVNLIVEKSDISHIALALKPDIDQSYLLPLLMMMANKY